MWKGLRSLKNIATDIVAPKYEEEPAATAADNEDGSGKQRGPPSVAATAQPQQPHPTHPPPSFSQNEAAAAVIKLEQELSDARNALQQLTVEVREARAALRERDETIQALRTQLSTVKAENVAAKQREKSEDAQTAKELTEYKEAVAALRSEIDSLRASKQRQSDDESPDPFGSRAHADDDDKAAAAVAELEVLKVAFAQLQAENEEIKQQTMEYSQQVQEAHESTVSYFNSQMAELEEKGRSQLAELIAENEELKARCVGNIGHGLGESAAQIAVLETELRGAEEVKKSRDAHLAEIEQLRQVAEERSPSAPPAVEGEGGGEGYTAAELEGIVSRLAADLAAVQTGADEKAAELRCEADEWKKQLHEAIDREAALKEKVAAALSRAANVDTAASAHQAEIEHQKQQLIQLHEQLTAVRAQLNDAHVACEQWRSRAEQLGANSSEWDKARAESETELVRTQSMLSDRDQALAESIAAQRELELELQRLREEALRAGHETDAAAVRELEEYKEAVAALRSEIDSLRASKQRQSDDESPDPFGSRAHADDDDKAAAAVAELEVLKVAFAQLQAENEEIKQQTMEYSQQVQEAHESTVSYFNSQMAELEEKGRSQLAELIAENEELKERCNSGNKDNKDDDGESAARIAALEEIIEKARGREEELRQAMSDAEAEASVRIASLETELRGAEEVKKSRDAYLAEIEQLRQVAEERSPSAPPAVEGEGGGEGYTAAELEGIVSRLAADLAAVQTGADEKAAELRCEADEWKKQLHEAIDREAALKEEVAAALSRAADHEESIHHLELELSNLAQSSTKRCTMVEGRARAMQKEKEAAVSEASRLQAEIASARAEANTAASARQAEIEQQKQQLIQLHEQLTAVRAQLNDAHVACEQWRSRAEQLGANSSEWDKARAESETELVRTQSMLSDRDQAPAESIAARRELELELQRLREEALRAGHETDAAAVRELEEYKEAVAAQQQEIDSLKRNRESLTQRLHDVESTNRQLTAQLTAVSEDAQRERASLQSAVETHNAKFSEVSERAQAAAQEIESLKQQLTAVKTSAAEQIRFMQSDAQSRVASAVSEKEEAAKTNAKMVKEAAASAKEVQRLQSIESNLKKEISALQAEMDPLRRRQSTLDAELAKAQIAVEQTKIQLADALKGRELERSTAAHHESTITALSSTNKEINTELTRLRELQLSLHRAVCELLLKHGIDLPSSAPSLSDVITLLAAEYTRCMDAVAAHGKLREQWEETFDQAKQVNEKSSQQLADAYKQLSEAKEEISLKEVALKRLTQQTKSEGSLVRELQDSNSKITSELHNAKDQLSDLQTIVEESKRAAAEAEAHSQSMTQLVSQLQSELRDRERDAAEAREATNNLQTALERLREQRQKDLEERTTYMTQESELLKAQIASHSAKLKEKSDEFNAAEDHHRREIASKTCIINGLRAKLAEMRKVIEETALKLNDDTMIDKRIVSHLLVNYVHSIVEQRGDDGDIVRVMSGLLSWDDAMMERAGLIPGPTNPKPPPGARSLLGGAISGWLRGSRSQTPSEKGAATPSRDESSAVSEGDGGKPKSLAELWVDFLLQESEKEKTK